MLTSRAPNHSSGSNTKLSTRKVERIGTKMFCLEGNVRRYPDAVVSICALDRQTLLMQRRIDKLEALECAGVDEWEWYDSAMEDLNEST